MSAPTVDISNLDKQKIPHDIMVQKVFESSHNMMDIAQTSLTGNPNLSKVVIMEHPPRFDDIIKSELAKTANNTLRRLQSISPFKNRIVIGSHSLECLGAGSDIHLDRYQDQYSKRYDGVHLYGRTGVRDYTNSVDSILLLALPGPSSVSARPEVGNRWDDHTKCEQAQYQWRMVQRRQNLQDSNTEQHRVSQHRYTQDYSHFTQSVPTQNRFNPLIQGN